MKRLLCTLVAKHQYLPFAIPQLKTLLRNSPILMEVLMANQLKNSPFQNWNEINHKSFTNYPFIELLVPEFNKHRHCSIKLTQFFKRFAIMLVIASGNNYDKLFENADQQILNQCRRSQQDYIVDVVTKNRAFGRQYQLNRINTVVERFNITGKVNLFKPKKRYQVIQNHSWYQGHHLSQANSTLKQVHFGVELCNNRLNNQRINQYSVNKRIYLGPTSTENDLAFIMCRQGLIQSGSLVVDPFVGTGSILLAASTFGAITFGMDLDYRVLHGISVGRINKASSYFKQNKGLQAFRPKINLNFQQFGFDVPNIIRADSTKFKLRNGEHFDAIITDPPYGLRATSISVRSNQKQTKNLQIAQEQQDQAKKSLTQFDKKFLKRNTNRQEIIDGLLDYSRKYLRKKGRLVFLYPVFANSNYKDIRDLPKWEGFDLIDASQNKISQQFSRILVTLQKK